MMMNPVNSSVCGIGVLFSCCSSLPHKAGTFTGHNDNSQAQIECLTITKNLIGDRGEVSETLVRTQRDLDLSNILYKTATV